MSKGELPTADPVYLFADSAKVAALTISLVEGFKAPVPVPAPIDPCITKDIFIIFIMDMIIEYSLSEHVIWIHALCPKALFKEHWLIVFPIEE